MFINLIEIMSLQWPICSFIGLKACNIPRFYQILGEFFFVFVLLEMLGISQEFKTFESI
jgi:hypothetical protein